MNPAPPCNGAWQDIESRMRNDVSPVVRESPSIVPAKDVLRIIELAEMEAGPASCDPWFTNAVNHIKRKCGL